MLKYCNTIIRGESLDSGSPFYWLLEKLWNGGTLRHSYIMEKATCRIKSIYEVQLNRQRTIFFYEVVIT
jgi:hypothetical protein